MQFVPDPEALLQLVLRSATVGNSVAAALRALDVEPALLVGGGKAGRPMVEAVLRQFPGIRGALAVPPEHAGPIGNVELIAAGHPLPDQGSIAAVELQERLLGDEAGPCLFLLSGGASALLGAPAAGIGLDRLRTVYAALLRSGLDIHAMNLVRRHLTRWGGGKFLRVAGERSVRTLVVSDVLDDDLSVIGSGPTVGDASSLEETRKILARLPGDFSDIMQATYSVAETVKPGDPLLRNGVTRIILSNRTVVDDVARQLGGKVLPAQVDDVRAAASRWADVLSGAPGVYVAGGEPTVNIPAGASGRGGRNQHLVAEIASRNPCGNWLFVSIATDGMDGNSVNAGAWVDSRTAAVANARGVESALESFDTATWNETEARVFHTGPTGTNVADVQIAFVR